MAVGGAIDAIFNDPTVGYDALYTHGAGAPVPVRILLRSPDAAFAPFKTAGQAPDRELELRVSEAPALAKGDVLAFALGAFPAASFPVQSFALDRNGYYWKIKVG